MKFKGDDKAVSEIIGTILLLFIAVFIFSALYISILLPVFFPDSNSAPVSVDIIGTLEGNTIILEHRGGDKLALDSMFLVTVGGIEQEFKVGDYLNIESKEDGYWTVGERIVFPAGDTAGIQVEITIIDVDSNYVALFGILQDGEIYTDPTVTTLDATEITTSSAKLWLNYYLKGHSGFVRFSYKPYGGSWTNTSWQAKSDGGSYNEIISGLNPCERYDFKAQLKYDTVEKEGAENNFTTSWTTIIDSISPYVETIAPLSITATGSSNLDNVSLFYRWSDDNSSWGHSGETIDDTPTIDNTASEPNNPGASSMSWTHTVSNGLNNSILIVCTNVEESIHSNYYLASADYNGDALTLAERVAADEGFVAVSEIWYLLNPDAGSNTVTVNFSQAVEQAVGGSASFSNVNQSTPDYTNTSNNTGDPTGLATGITTDVDNALIITVATDGQGSLAYSYGSRQTQFYNVNSPTHEGAGSYEIPSGTGDYTMYTNLSGASNRMSQVVVAWASSSITWGNGTNWAAWNNANNPDTASPWNWDFDFPNGAGFYEFHSIGMKDDNIEDPPGSADAICRYNPS